MFSKLHKSTFCFLKIDIYMYVTVAWPELGFLQHSNYGVVRLSSFRDRFSYGHPFRCSLRCYSDEDFADCGPDDGSGGPMVGYYPHFPLEFGQDDDALRRVCFDGDSLWRDPYCYRCAFATQRGRDCWSSWLVSREAGGWRWYSPGYSSFSSGE